MTKEEQAFLALLAIGVFSVDAEGRIWRHRKLIGSRLGAPSRWEILPEPTRAETSHSGARENGTVYLRVMFSQVEGVRLSIDAHRLVWMVRSASEIPTALEVNHKNGNGLDNHPSNLELVTRSQNVKHAIHVLGKIKRPKKMNGDKITPAQVLEIRDLCDRRAMTLTEIARRYELTVRSVQNIAARKTWKHVPAFPG